MKLEEVEHIMSLSEIEMECYMEKKLQGSGQFDKYESYEYEVWCFWSDYLLYQKKMLELGIVPKKIVDIGCHLGIQSVIFDVPYLGIDIFDNKDYFWQKSKNEYMVGKFYDKKFEGLVDGNVVISNMSLGYFMGTDYSDIAEGLKNAQLIFIAAPKPLVEAIAVNGNFKIEFLYENERPFLFGEIDGRYMLHR